MTFWTTTMATESIWYQDAAHGDTRNNTNVLIWQTSIPPPRRQTERRANISSQQSTRIRSRPACRDKRLARARQFPEGKRRRPPKERKENHSAWANRTDHRCASMRRIQRAVIFNRSLTLVIGIRLYFSWSEIGSRLANQNGNRAGSSGGLP